MSRGNFKSQLADFDRSCLDEDLCQSFAGAIANATGAGGRPLREELESCALEFSQLSGKPESDLGSRRNHLIGRLRQLVARAAVDYLEPDLVILDEFQRFKGLLDGDDEGARLANAIFDHPDAKVLLLSATPYKMYTLPDEPEGDDHYRDFTRTMCATRRSAISLAQRGEIGGISLDLMANLDLKGEGKNSMPENRRSCPGVWGEVPGDPRDMAKLRCEAPCYIPD